MSGKTNNLNALKHGVNTLKRILSNGKLDGRSAIGQLIKRIRAGIEADLKGNLSGREEAIVDRCVFKIVVLLSIEGWTMKRRALVRRGGSLPAILDRNYISWSESLRRDFVSLGLKRKVRDINLNDLLNKGGQR